MNLSQVDEHGIRKWQICRVVSPFWYGMHPTAHWRCVDQTEIISHHISWYWQWQGTALLAETCTLRPVPEVTGVDRTLENNTSVTVTRIPLALFLLCQRLRVAEFQQAARIKSERVHDQIITRSRRKVSTEYIVALQVPFRSGRSTRMSLSDTVTISLLRDIVSRNLGVAVSHWTTHPIRFHLQAERDTIDDLSPCWYFPSLSTLRVSKRFNLYNILSWHSVKPSILYWTQNYFTHSFPPRSAPISKLYQYQFHFYQFWNFFPFNQLITDNPIWQDGNLPWNAPNGCRME